MDKASPKKFMYVSRVADMLCCSEKHVYELIKDDKLEAIRLGKCAIRVSKDSVLDFIEQNKIDPTEYSY